MDRCCWGAHLIALNLILYCCSGNRLTLASSSSDQLAKYYEKSLKFDTQYKNGAKYSDETLDQPQRRYHRQVDRHQSLSTMLETECSADNVRIVFKYKTRRARLMGNLRQILEKLSLYAARVHNSLNVSSVSELPSECMGFRDDKEGKLILNLRLCQGCCGMEEIKSVDNETLGHRLLVSLSLEDAMTSEMTAFKEEYNVSCIKPSVSSSEGLGRIDIKLYEDSRSDSPLNFPKYIDMSEQLYVKGDFISKSDLLAVDIRAFPLNCWLSLDDNSVIQRHHRRLFLRNGCPAKNDKNRGLSTVHQSSKNGLVRVGFRVSEYLLHMQATASSVREDSRMENETVMVQCEFMLCVHSNLNALSSFPRCPETSYCSDPTAHGLMILPFNVHSNNLFTLKAGPLIVQKPTQHDNGRHIPLNDVPRRRFLLTKNECRCPDATHFTVSPAKSHHFTQPNAHVYVKETGFSTRASIFIALASFLCGVASTAFIYFCRGRTEKQQRAKLYEMREPPSALNPSSVGLIAKLSSTNVDRCAARE